MTTVFIDNTEYVPKGRPTFDIDEVRNNIVQEVIIEINSLIANQEACLEEFKEFGLTANSVEAEGGLRMLYLVKNNLSYLMSV